MPTYVCTTRTGALDDQQRAAIAKAISVAHGEATGAPAFFAQVQFDEKAAGRRFFGGTSADDHIWIRGDVRAGRTDAQRALLIQAILRSVAAIAKVEESAVWIYLCPLAPTDMVEYGHVLPPPGDEQTWLDSLPPALRDYLTKLGARAPAS